MIDLSLAPRQQSERYRPPEVDDDPLEQFRQRMIDCGLVIDHVDTSGSLNRVDVEKRGDKAGWYVFYDGDICAGAFGNWKTDLNEKWCSKSSRDLTEEERTEYARKTELAKQQREQLKIQLNAEARQRALKIWENSNSVITHPYLERKGIVNYGLRESQGNLVIPLRDESGDIQSLQFITPEKDTSTREKNFLKNGKIEGCSFTINGGNSLMICEGYSTGCSIHQATGATVVCAMNAGNILPVAKLVRAKCPTAQITICADNDRFKAGNRGVTAATEAAKAINAKLVVPNFDTVHGGDDPELKFTDFNDLATAGGIELVRQQINGGFAETGKLPPLHPTETSVDSWLKKRPDPIKFIFRINDQGLIPAGVVGVLAAEGGCGKTFFLLSLAVAGANGGNFGPINAPKPLNTLIVLCEDDQDMMGRRLWDIGKGKFPKNLYAASVYGKMGPLMRLDGNNPVLSDMWFWLDETISNHKGLDLLIIDPKSRFYGLDENNNDHATQWISALEKLAQKHGVTILFSSHTSKGNAKEISQGMVRGGGGIVDGCRWQGGMVRMSDEIAKRFCVDNPRDYVLFDTPKSNYASDLPSMLCFKRGENGVLQYCEPQCELRDEMGEALLEILTNDPMNYSKDELVYRQSGRGIASDMKDRFPGFVRSKDMAGVIDRLLYTKKLFEVNDSAGSSFRPKTILSINPF